MLARTRTTHCRESKSTKARCTTTPRGHQRTLLLIGGPSSRRLRATKSDKVFMTSRTFPSAVLRVHNLCRGFDDNQNFYSFERSVKGGVCVTTDITSIFDPQESQLCSGVAEEQNCILLVFREHAPFYECGSCEARHLD